MHTGSVILQSGNLAGADAATFQVLLDCKETRGIEFAIQVGPQHTLIYFFVFH
jgi:hypothetical protein